MNCFKGAHKLPESSSAEGTRWGSSVRCELGSCCLLMWLCISQAASWCERLLPHGVWVWCLKMCTFLLTVPPNISSWSPETDWEKVCWVVHIWSECVGLQSSYSSEIFTVILTIHGFHLTTLEPALTLNSQIMWFHQAIFVSLVTLRETANNRCC